MCELKDRHRALNFMNLQTASLASGDEGTHPPHRGLFWGRCNETTRVKGSASGYTQSERLTNIRHLWQGPQDHPQVQRFAHGGVMVDIHSVGLCGQGTQMSHQGEDAGARRILCTGFLMLSPSVRGQRQHSLSSGNKNVAHVCGLSAHQRLK